MFLFQVALAIFKLCEPKLMTAEDMGVAIETLRNFETSCFNAGRPLPLLMMVPRTSLSELDSEQGEIDRSEWSLGVDDSQVRGDVEMHRGQSTQPFQSLALCCKFRMNDAAGSLRL